MFEHTLRAPEWVRGGVRKSRDYEREGYENVEIMSERGMEK